MSDEEYESAEIEDEDDEDEAVSYDFDSAELDNEFKELQLLQLELQLLQQLKYRGGYLVSEHGTGVTVMVAFPVNFLSELQIVACGLRPNLDVVIVLTFPSSPPCYLASCPSAGKVTVRQSSDTCLNSKQTLTDSVKFGLWWTLEQRLTEYLQEMWDVLYANCMEEMARAKERNKIIPWNQIMKVLQLAHDTDVPIDLRLATYIVQQTKGRMDMVQETLFDEERMTRARKAAEKEPMYFDDPNWPKFSLLLHVVDYLKGRIRICTERCIVCDKKLPIPLLKPTACDSELCNYQMADLGLGVNLESEILRNPLVVDLLICCTYAAAEKKNRYTNFPFQKEAGGNGTKDRASYVHDLLRQCPSVAEMREVIEKGESLKDFLKPVLYNLVRWIIASNTSHIEYIHNPDQRVPNMPEYQFILNSSTPTAEARFQELKKQHNGSFFAFHGSALESWHNILRGGLKKMDIRTAYGPGIYLATNASTSLSYMLCGSGFPKSRFGGTMRIMALCEVVAEGSEKQCLKRVHRPRCECNKQSPHIRVEAEEALVTRVLFVFTESGGGSYSVDAKNIKLPHVDRIGQETFK